MARPANVENRQSERCAHEDDCRPRGEPREHVGRCPGTESGLRTLAAKGACEVSGAALLQQDDSNEKQADDDMDHDDEIEENLHCFSCFPRPIRLHRSGKLFGAEEGT